MCKGNACGCGGGRSGMGLPVAVLAAVAVAVGALDVVITDVLVAILVTLSVACAAGLGVLGWELRRNPRAVTAGRWRRRVLVIPAHTVGTARAVRGGRAWNSVPAPRRLPELDAAGRPMLQGVVEHDETMLP